MIVLLVSVTGCTGDILTKAGVGNFGSTTTPAAVSGNPGADTTPGSSGTAYGDCMKTCTQYSGQTDAQCTQACCISDCSETSADGSDACVGRCLGVTLQVTPAGSATPPTAGTPAPVTHSGFTCDYNEYLLKTSPEFSVWFNTSCYYNTYCGWWESADLMPSGQGGFGDCVNCSPESFLETATPTHTPCPARTPTPAATPAPVIATATVTASGICGEGLTSCRVFSTDYCVDLQTDVKHCGACRKGCLLQHAENGCAGGQCYIKSCEKGWADCNGLAADGCEVDLNADDNNCGSCGRVCSLPNAGHSVCNGLNENGKCEVQYCTTGWQNANGIHDDGCEARAD